jgi:oxygen-independent coproporphyrinogen-3 oxidase
MRAATASPCHRDAEITMEANPESSPAAKLEGFRQAGANRLSFGVQSFHDEELRRLGRLHSSQAARDAVRGARAAGFDNLSLDLMMWLPGQSTADWLSNVDALIALEPDHASLYLLEIYPNAPLRDEMARAGWSVAPTTMRRRCTWKGWRVSIVPASSNMKSRMWPGRRRARARHNLKYWQEGEWLAFGCGAHATFRGERWRTVSSTLTILIALPPAGMCASSGGRWARSSGSKKRCSWVFG